MTVNSNRQSASSMPAWAKVLLYVRSSTFFIVFYTVLAAFLIFGIWLLIAPRSWAMRGLFFHGKTSLWLLRLVCGTRIEIRNRENLLPPPVIVASKHQSTWDTFALVTLMNDPALVMKSELLSVPLYGWFCRKFGMIAIARDQGASALRNMFREARNKASSNREIVIFPEGTRRTPFSPPNYKPGIALLYQALNLPVCPIALNSGVFWRHHSFLRFPGMIVIECLTPLAPGLSRKDFMQQLEQSIETASDRLTQEAYADLARSNK